MFLRGLLLLVSAWQASLGLLMHGRFGFGKLGKVMAGMEG